MYPQIYTSGLILYLATSNQVIKVTVRITVNKNTCTLHSVCVLTFFGIVVYM